MKIGSGTFNSAAGAVNDIFSSQFSAKSLEIKAGGDIAEGQAYGKAAELARENAAFTEQSTAIQEMQATRNLTLNLGAQRAAAASSGFEASGSALDVLRDSAAQGALQKQVLQQQGLITEAGYKEQGESYDIMSKAAFTAAEQEKDLAGQEKTAGYISGAIKAASAVASIF
jgi:hypothetical protein